MLNDLDRIESKKQIIASIIMFGIVLLTLTDMIYDKSDGVGWGHLIIEMLVVLGGLAVILCLWWHTLVLSANQRSQLQKNLMNTSADLEQWKARSEKLLAGLGYAIEQQFNAWKLTEAEKEVGLLLLKGLSVKEIAVIRETAEKTVRHQAAAVYGKGGVEGRRELSAFFLEDLLLPKNEYDPEAT
jgi:DNA-binding CsgD family transcriptional regulator